MEKREGKGRKFKKRHGALREDSRNIEPIAWRNEKKEGTLSRKGEEGGEGRAISRGEGTHLP